MTDGWISKGPAVVVYCDGPERGDRHEAVPLASYIRGDDHKWAPFPSAMFRGHTFPMATTSVDHFAGMEPLPGDLARMAERAVVQAPEGLPRHWRWHYRWRCGTCGFDLSVNDAPLAWGLFNRCTRASETGEIALREIAAGQRDAATTRR